MKYTKYELARIIGARALQISQGAPLMIDLSKKDFEKLRYSNLEIAMTAQAHELLIIEGKETSMAFCPPTGSMIRPACG